MICLLLASTGMVQADRAEYLMVLEMSEMELKTTPDDTSALHNKAISLAGLGRYEEAVDTFREIIKIRDDVSIIYIDLGESLRNLEEYDQAIEAYEHAINMDSENSYDTYEAWIGKGRVLNDMGMREEALEAYNTAIQSDYPEFLKSEAWNLKRITYEQLEQYDNALIAYEKRLEILKSVPPPTGTIN